MRLSESSSCDPGDRKEETTNEQPSNTNTLTVGQVVVNKADGSFYTIKKNAGKVHEVEYKAPKTKTDKDRCAGFYQN